MGKFDDLDTSAGVWAAQLYATAEANVRSFFANVDATWVLLLFIVAMITAMAIVVISMLNKKSESSSNVPPGRNESEDGKPLVGILECFDALGKKIEENEVFTEEPEWDFCGEDDGGVVNYTSSSDGDSEEIEMKSDEFALYRSQLPDKNGDTDGEWLVVVVGILGEVIFREIVHSRKRPDCSDNCIRTWDREGRDLTVYCGIKLDLVAMKPDQKPQEVLRTAAD